MSQTSPSQMGVAHVPEARAAPGAAPEPMTQVEPSSAGAMTDAEFLRHWLSSRSESCPLCRYNLRGLLSDRCPECGRELRLAVQLVELSQRWWLMLFIPLAMVAGVGALFLLVVVKEGRVPGRNEGALLPAMMLSFVGIPLALTALLSRRSFLRAPDGAQTLMGLCGPVYALVVFSLFFASIR
jgi:hypothetical protein